MSHMLYCLSNKDYILAISNNSFGLKERQHMLGELLKKENRQAVLFPLFDIFLNGLNFIIILFISLKLSERDFTTFTALIALGSILLILGVSVQTFTAKIVQTNKNILGSVKKMVFGLNITFTFAFIVSYQWLVNYMKASDLGLILILVMVNLHLITSYERGVLQGRSFFKHLNISFYIEVLSRVSLTLFLFYQNPDYEKAVLALNVGMLMAYLHGRYINRDFEKNKENDIVGKTTKVLNSKLWHQILSVAAANGAIYFIINIALLTANSRVIESSGTYSLSSKFAQLMIAVSMSITTVLIPKGAAIVKNQVAFKRFVVKSSFVIFGILTFVWVGYQVVLPIGLPMIYGSEGVNMVKMIRIQSIGYIFFGVTQMIVMMEVIKDRKSHLVILGLMAILYTIFLNRMTLNVQSIIQIEVLFHGFLMVFVSINFMVAKSIPLVNLQPDRRKETIL